MRASLGPLWPHCATRNFGHIARRGQPSRMRHIPATKFREFFAHPAECDTFLRQSSGNFSRSQPNPGFNAGQSSGRNPAEYGLMRAKVPGIFRTLRDAGQSSGNFSGNFCTLRDAGQSSGNFCTLRDAGQSSGNFSRTHPAECGLMRTKVPGTQPNAG